MSASAVLSLQYSEKEDKYEEEIKVLNDRLKEVSSFPLKLNRVDFCVLNMFPCLLKGGNPCRICRKDSGKAGKDHR